MRTIPFVLALVCARALCGHPEIEEALDRLNVLLAASPGAATLYLERGALYARHEDWIDAEANYLRAAELAPNLPGLDYVRAALELATGNAPAARAHLNRALKLDPADAEAFILRAQVHATLGDRVAALADFNAGLARIATPSPELYLARAQVAPSPDAAVRGLEEGLARLGPVLTLELRALALEESLERTDAALARLDRIAAQSERKEGWLKRRGDLLARAGRHREARAAYAAALRAIATLPAWLRESPDTARLTSELKNLTS